MIALRCSLTTIFLGPWRPLAIASPAMDWFYVKTTRPSGVGDLDLRGRANSPDAFCLLPEVWATSI